jgi:hypothetical protein
MGGIAMSIKSRIKKLEKQAEKRTQPNIHTKVDLEKKLEWVNDKLEFSSKIIEKGSSRLDLQKVQNLINLCQRFKALVCEELKKFE